MIVCNLVIAALCGLAAVLEFNNGMYGAMFAYGGFGLGYVGLAVVYSGY